MCIYLSCFTNSLDLLKLKTEKYICIETMVNNYILLDSYLAVYSLRQQINNNT